MDTVDVRGRIRKTYPAEQIMTRRQWLRSIPNFERHLKPAITAHILDETAMPMTDSQPAQRLQERRCNHSLHSGASAADTPPVAAA